MKCELTPLHLRASRADVARLKLGAHAHFGSTPPGRISLPCPRAVRRRLKGLSAQGLPALRQALATLGLSLTLSPLGVVALAGVALADPLAGVVVSGSASISQPTPGHRVIEQTTDKAVINWQEFNVGLGEHTQFIQPSTNSVTLNRVTGQNASEILGRLTANGNIMLVNQNGIVFGSNAQVDVGGLVASTADLSNDDFNAGNLRFNQAGKDNAQITNQGTITARSGGSISMVAPLITNQGTITAHLGKIQLASGNTWALDMGGLLKLALDDQVAGALIQAGLVSADGGRIELTANVVQGMMQQAVQVSGTTQARTVGVNQRGNIVIGGGPGAGTVSVSGTLDVSGLADGQRGGEVTVTAERVALLDGAQIAAQGQAGGGEVKIGGDYQGGGTTHRAEQTFVASRATINADAIQQGNAGRVILWSDLGTQFYGNITARGGFVAGDGGFVEVSGLENLEFAGQVITTAVNGANGTLLLDPYDLTIINAPDSNVTAATPFSSTGNSGVLDVDTLISALASGNVIVQTGAGGAQNGDITVTDAISWTGNNSLTLQAHRNINVNNTITHSGGTGGLSLVSTGATGAITVASGIAVGGDLSLSSNTLAVNANLSGSGVLSLFPNLANTTITVGTGGTGTFQLDTNEVGRLQPGWSSILLGRSDGTGALDLRAATWQSDLTLRSLSGTVTVNGTQTLGTNDLTIRTNGINLAVANSLTGSGVLTIEQANNTTTMGFGASATGTLNLDANEVGRITDGWSLINLGRTDNTVGMQIRATTWNDPVVFRNGTGAITTSTGNTVGNGNASFTYDSPVTLSNNITTVSGDIIFNSSFTIGSGLTPVITTTSGDVVFNGAVNGVAGGSAENLTIAGGAGSGVSFASTVGATNALGSLSVTADTINLGGNITGTATLTLQPGQDSTSVGLGDGASGTFHLSSAEINRIQNGFTSILIGRTTSTAAYDLRSSSWNDPVNFRSSTTATGTLTGDITALGNATVTLGVPTLFNGNSISTVGQAITLSGASTIAEGQTLTLTNGGAAGNITISGTLNGTTGGAAENLIVNAGTGTFNNTAIIGGTAALGDFTLTADTLTIGANIAGTGTAILQPLTQNRQIGIGNSSTGAFQLDSTEATRLVNGWGQLIVGRTDGTGAVNIRSVTFTDPLLVRTDTGVITTTTGALVGSGDAAFGFTFNNSFTVSNGITTAGGDIVFNGTGTLTLSSNLTTAGGDIDFNTPVIIGSGTTPILSFGAGTVTVDNTVNGVAGGGAENLTFTGGNGSHVEINAAVGATAALGAITLTTDNLDLAANLTGTGALIIQQASATTTFGIGDSMTGTLHLSDAEIARIQNGFSGITLGATTATGIMEIGSSTAWRDPLTLRSAAGGSLQILGSLLGDDNASINLTTAPIVLGDGSNITTNGQNLTLGTAVTLAEGASATLSTGVGAGNITLSSTLNGTAGGVDENLTIIAGTGTFTNSGIIGGTVALGDLHITADLMTISQNINGLGTLTLQPQTQGQTIGIGTSAVGLLNLDSNEQQRLDNTWNEIIIGRADGIGAIDLRAATWVDPLTLRGSTSVLTVNGAQNMGANNLTITTDGLVLSNNLTGTGDLVIAPGQIGTGLGLGNSATGGLNLDATEVSRLSDGWNSITLGRADGTGNLDLRATTWNDPITFLTTGLITSGGNLTGSGNASLTFAAPTLLGHDIVTANQDIIFNDTLTLAANASLSTGAGAGNIHFTDMVDGDGFNLTLTAGTGDITFAQAVSNLGSGTGAALTVNSTQLLTVQNTLAANSGLAITGTSLWSNNVTLGNGDTASVWNGDVTFDGLTLSGYDGFTFSNPVTLTTGAFVLNSQGGDLTFSSTLNGTQNFTADLNGGNLAFAAAVGGINPLSNVTLTNLGTLTSDAFNATNFTASATGNASFSGAGLITSNNLSLTAQNISGAFTANLASLLATSNITAQVDLNGLSISGLTATLTGDVGPAPQNQAMANRVAKLTTPGSLSDYTLNGFAIGFNVAPITTVDVMSTTIWGPSLQHTSPLTSARMLSQMTLAQRPLNDLPSQNVLGPDNTENTAPPEDKKPKGKFKKWTGRWSGVV